MRQRLNPLHLHQCLPSQMFLIQLRWPHRHHRPHLFLLVIRPRYMHIRRRRQHML